MKPNKSNDMELKSRMNRRGDGGTPDGTYRQVRQPGFRGTYARKLGYSVYKPMRNGKICHFYVNPAIRDDEAGKFTKRTFPGK